VLVTLADGSDRIFAGQKSGMVYAMDPDDSGKQLWSKRVGSGGTMGGVHWGMSADQQRLYVGVSDAPTRNPYIVGEPQPGVNALNFESGEFIWRNKLPYVCDPNLKFACWQGISAAVSSSPGLVFVGGLDGRLRALDADTGEQLWSYETLREYETVNGIAGQGGAIEADGPVIANGRLFVTSGYDKWGELPGNVLLVFAPRSQ
jgi:polyvinyl alcohol dehydrogenase (cytochrome)